MSVARIWSNRNTMSTIIDITKETLEDREKEQLDELRRGIR
jgi:DNA-binding XRE family transcriptional regulator